MFLCDRYVVMSSILSEPEVKAYHEQGFVIPEFQLSESETGILREALEKVIRDNPETRPERLVSVHISKEGRAEDVKVHDAFLVLAQDGRIVDMVSQLIGPDVSGVANLSVNLLVTVWKCPGIRMGTIGQYVHWRHVQYGWR